MTLLFTHEHQIIGLGTFLPINLADLKIIKNNESFGSNREPIICDLLLYKSQLLTKFRVYSFGHLRCAKSSENGRLCRAKC